MLGIISSIVIGASAGLCSILPGLSKQNSIQLADQLGHISNSHSGASIAVAAATGVATIVESVKQVITPNASSTIISSTDYSLLKVYKPSQALALLTTNKLGAGLLGVTLGCVAGSLVSSSAVMTGAALLIHLCNKPSVTKTLATLGIACCVLGTATLVSHFGLLGLSTLVASTFMFIPSAYRGLKQKVLLQQPARTPEPRQTSNSFVLNPFSALSNSVSATSTSGVSSESTEAYLKDAVNSAATETLIESFALGAGLTGTLTGKAVAISMIGANFGVLVPLTFILCLCIAPLFLGALCKWYSSWPIATINLLVLLVNIIQVGMYAGIYTPIFIGIGLIGNQILKRDPSLAKVLYLGALFH